MTVSRAFSMLLCLQNCYFYWPLNIPLVFTAGLFILPWWLLTGVRYYQSLWSKHLSWFHGVFCWGCFHRTTSQKSLEGEKNVHGLMLFPGSPKLPPQCALGWQYLLCSSKGKQISTKSWDIWGGGLRRGPREIHSCRPSTTGAQVVGSGVGVILHLGNYVKIRASAAQV